MLKFAILRLLWSMLTVLMAVLLVFTLTRLAPGDPVDVIAGPRASPEVRQRIREIFHLGEPLIVQLGYFVSNILRGELGMSIMDREPVSTKILRALPYTVTLAFFSMFWTFVLAVVLGSLSAVYANTWIGHLISNASLAMISVAPFVVGIVLLLVFSVKLPLFPLSGVGKPDNLLDKLHHLVLPSIAISVGWLGFMCRTIKARMLDVLGTDYIKMHRSFGLPLRYIWGKYALRNAVLPAVSQLGFAIGRFLGGAVFIEMIFARPGIGRLLSTSVFLLDFPVLQGTVLVTAVMFVLSNFLADLSHGFIDPRIRYK